MQTVYRMEKKKTENCTHPLLLLLSFRGCINVAIIGGRKVFAEFENRDSLRAGWSRCVESWHTTQDTRRRIVVWTNARFELNTRRLIDSRDPNAGPRINKRRRYTPAGSRFVPRKRSVPRAENSPNSRKTRVPCFIMRMSLENIC